MPNWCENILTIEDCSPELESYLEENGLSFEKIKPTPPELLDEHGGWGGWYSWRVGNWGTKWDLSEQEQREVADLLVSDMCDSATFMTAWAPPCAAIVALSEQFPNDKFVLRYVEFGMSFAGTTYISNGDFSEEEADDINQFAVDYFGYDMDDLCDGQDD